MGMLLRLLLRDVWICELVVFFDILYYFMHVVIGRNGGMILCKMAMILYFASTNELFHLHTKKDISLCPNSSALHHGKNGRYESMYYFHTSFSCPDL